MIPDSLKEKYLQALFDRYKELSTVARFIFGFIVLFLFLFSARLGFLGIKTQNVSKVILPFNISHVDQLPARLKIVSSFEHLKNGKFEPIINGGIYRSNEIMSIKYTTNMECWLFIVGLSNTGVQSMKGANLEAVKYHPYDDTSYDVIDFKLDDTKGFEQYYIFASKERFSFSLDIQPRMKNIKHKSSPKGAIPFNQVDLREGIIYKAISFSHS